MFPKNKVQNSLWKASKLTETQMGTGRSYKITVDTGNFVPKPLTDISSNFSALRLCFIKAILVDILTNLHFSASFKALSF